MGSLNTRQDYRRDDVQTNGVQPKLGAFLFGQMGDSNDSRDIVQRRYLQMEKTMQNEERFQQLLDLAAEGNQEAIGDLWLEFGYRFEGGEA